MSFIKHVTITLLILLGRVGPSTSAIEQDQEQRRQGKDCDAIQTLMPAKACENPAAEHLDTGLSLP